MHDAHGIPLKIGDHVLIPATITELSPQDDFCNVSLRSQIGRRPDGQHEFIHAINTGVLIRVGEE